MLSVLFLFYVSVSSALDLSLGVPSYGGNGCPAGSASIALSPDNTSLSILFDSYMAEAGSNGKMLDRKSCNVAIPVHVPQGFSISIFKFDYRGFVNIPEGGQGSLNAEYFFAGQRGPMFRKYFGSGYSDNYMFTNRLLATAVIWSPCGKDVILRSNSNMLVRSNSDYEDTMGTVDSIDVDSGIIYYLTWRACTY